MRIWVHRAGDENLGKDMVSLQQSRALRRGIGFRVVCAFQHSSLHKCTCVVHLAWARDEYCSGAVCALETGPCHRIKSKARHLCMVGWQK